MQTWYVCHLCMSRVMYKRKRKRGRKKGERREDAVDTADPLNFIRIFTFKGHRPKYCSCRSRFNIWQRSIKFHPFASTFAPN